MGKTKSEILKKVLVVGVILCMQIPSFNAVLAEEATMGTAAVTAPTAVAETSAPTALEEKKPSVMGETEKKQGIFLINLRQQLQNARTDYFQVDKNIDIAKERLVEVNVVIDSLKAQIENMNYLIRNTQAKITNVSKQVAQKENTIEVILEDIQIKKIEIENQKILLKEYLELLYLQENSFYDSSSAQNVSVSKLLLADASVGDTFKEIQYFAILEQTGQNIFNNLEETEKEYKNQRTELIQTQQKLTKLNVQLEEEKTNLKLQQNAKKNLLEKTKGEEEIYRELISQSKREQLQILAEINVLKENLLFVEQKIKQDGANFNPDNYGDLINPNVRAIYDFEINGDFADGEQLNWPVPPTRGISAYFRDSSYQTAFGIPHNAIDLPTPQGTPIRAPASGVVYKVKDNGDESYAYIILAHKGGLLTVYGHMSEILVNDRDIVLPGEIIGLSGGIPGSKGAGYLTTGAHLHFEVLQNGKYIDPLLVLPLDVLGEDVKDAILGDTDEATTADEPDTVNEPKVLGVGEVTDEPATE